MPRKKRIKLMIPLVSLFVPSVIIGSTYLGIKAKHNTNNFDDSIFEFDKDGKINLNQMTMGIYSTDMNLFIKNIKKELNDRYFNQTNIDFNYFVFEINKFDFINNEFEFTATESVKYQKKYIFKFNLVNLNEIMNEEINIGNILNYNDDYESKIKILSTKALYKNDNSEYINNIIDDFNNSKINIEANFVSFINNEKVEKYQGHINYVDEYDHSKLDSLNFIFYSTKNEEDSFLEIDKNFNLISNSEYVDGITKPNDDGTIEFTNEITILEKIDDNHIFAYSYLNSKAFLIEINNNEMNVLSSKTIFSLKQVILINDNSFLAITGGRKVLLIEIDTYNQAINFKVCSYFFSNFLNSIVQLNDGTIVISSKDYSGNAKLFFFSFDGEEINELQPSVSLDIDKTKEILEMKLINDSENNIFWNDGNNNYGIMELINSEFGFIVNIHYLESNLLQSDFLFNNAMLSINDSVQNLYAINKSGIYKTSLLDFEKINFNLTSSLSVPNKFTASARIKNNIFISTSEKNIVVLNTYD